MSAIVEHYARLVKIAYVVLPASMGRRRRVLLAHRIAQRALPHTRKGCARGDREAVDPAYALVRDRTLRAALAHARPRTGWRRWGRAALLAVPAPPQIVGLRVFPRSGGAEESALDRGLAELAAPARAAYALYGIERLAVEDTVAVLTAAGVADPRGAVREAAVAVRRTDARLLASGEFDPCVLHVRPTDLLRRRQHARAAGAAVATVALAVGLLGVPGDDGGPTGASGPLAAQRAALGKAIDPAAVVRTSPDAWLRSDRFGFGGWPARGGRAGDRELIGRALSAWARPDAGLRVAATTGTSRTGPASPPRLLFAGNVDSSAVALFHDGQRLVRYAEPLSGAGPAALDLARVDAADGASASAVVLDRSDGNARYLTAPWIDKVASRDLLKPSAVAQPVGRSADGVTSPVPTAITNPGCGGHSPQAPASGWPALQLTPRPGVPGLRPFLLTDLDDLTPVHLTYAAGAAGSRVEASGPEALTAWGHSACRLAGLRGAGVRTAGVWQFADQTLPDRGGLAHWMCTRADTWAGDDDRVLLQFLPPTSAVGAPTALSASARATPACGPLDPAVLSGVLWKSPAGRWYLLAAGSPEVVSVSVSGGLTYSAPNRVIALPATRTTRATLTGRRTDGSGINALK